MKKPEINVITNVTCGIYEVHIWDGKNGSEIHASYDLDNAINEGNRVASNMQWKLNNLTGE